LVIDTTLLNTLADTLIVVVNVNLNVTHLISVSTIIVDTMRSMTKLVSEQGHRIEALI
jgi:hypothetical protein